MLGAASDQGALGGFLLQVQEPGNLRLPLDCGMKLEVSVDDPDGTETCLHGDFQRNAPHAALHTGSRPGQQVTRHLPDRQARQRHIAETARSAVSIDGLDRWAEHRPVIRQQRRKLGTLVGGPA